MVLRSIDVKKNHMFINFNTKHAFLILAHTQPNLLKRLLKRLDHDRVDIFLHLDKKANFNEDEIKRVVKKSKLYLTHRLNVTWGSYSMIQAELLLLKESTNTGSYIFYHLLTGQDYLLKSIDKILNSYDKTPEVNYISFKDDEVVHFIDRLRLFYPLQELIGRTHGCLYCLQYILKIIQKLLKIYRPLPNKVGFGAQFFDITDDFARWIVKKQADWNPLFTNTFCSDELFVQTLYLQYEKERKTNLCRQEDKDYSFFDRAGITIKRAIDWKRGNPYIWVRNDWKILRDSNLLFVRKVDDKKSKELLDLLDEMKG